MKREGKDVISLGAGEPDFATPYAIQQAATHAIQKGNTKYTAVSGIYELRQAISNWINNEYSVIYSPENIVVTSGAKHAIYQSIIAICDPGDEIIVPIPYWVSYPAQIELAGGVVKTITPQTMDLKITAEQIDQAITAKTKAIILNSPCNPSGVVYSKPELEAIARVIKRNGIYVISDEIYDKIIFDALEYSSMTYFADVRDQLIYVNGVSKSFAMTGWRIGFLAANSQIVSAVKKYQGHSTTHPTTISQVAALEAYRGDQSFHREMVAAFQQRRDYVMQRLSTIKKTGCVFPRGAFYAFPDLSLYYNKNMGIKSSLELCYYLLEQFGVGLVPGQAFGMDTHVRLSFATSLDVLKIAFDRIESGLKSLAP
ncbi:pyridoxal phosphate-dependent aminotransferase [candidate division KSB1 bacterium]|nr:pyridoxal phosphate-dependent aminotransferase [candidate division KSB1 bacterium]